MRKEFFDFLVVDQQHRILLHLAYNNGCYLQSFVAGNSLKISDFDLTTPGHCRKNKPKFDREEKTLKILRFNDDRIGVIKDGNMVVDVSDTVSARKAKGPQRVMEEIIEGWRKYRRRFEKVLAEQSGVPLDSVQLRSPFARPGKFLAAFSNYIDRPERTADNFPNEYFYKSPDLVGPGEAVELSDIPACVVYQPEAEFAFIIGKTAKDVTGKESPRSCFRLCAVVRYFHPRPGAAHPVHRQRARIARLLRPVDHYQG